MFNIVNLILTSIISMGMALNVMPFDNESKNENNIHELTPKKANESSDPYVNNYSLQINFSNEQESYLSYSGEYAYLKEFAKRYTANATSNYINVIGNIYRSWVYTDTGDGTQVQNHYTLNGNYENFDPKATMASEILKITPYNYNVNNEIRVTISMAIQSTFDTQLDYIRNITNKYVYRAIYQTTENLDSYINKQLTLGITNQIQKEITNVNNGFYYTKNETIVERNNNDWMLDDIEINLTPNKDNYIFIQYIPMVDATETNRNDPTDTGIITSSIIGVNLDEFDIIRIPGYQLISGTNVIPNATYEVIDIPGLMWEIIQMPFAFVSQAFNLTLFPGTPYQLNIANLFLSIIAVLVFVWLITFFLKMKG